jgi:broad specificity phosphatase PhoE
LGEWQGIPHEALPALLTRPAHPFWPHAGEEHPPGGESFREVQARVAGVLERLATLLEGQDIVIVAHGGSIRAALSHAMGLSPDQALVFSIKNLSLTRIEKHGLDWRVASVNEEPWTPPSPES